MKARFWVVLVVLGALLCGGLLADESESVWARGWTGEGAGLTGLQLIGVAQLRMGLRGTFVYYNMSKTNEPAEPIVIAGVRSPEGTFWPDATLQVKKTVASEWETVGKSTGKGQPETITVAPNDASKVLQIDFDDFKRFMLTHKIGRVIISTGATVEFEFEVLTPPSNGGS